MWLERRGIRLVDDWLGRSLVLEPGRNWRDPFVSRWVGFLDTFLVYNAAMLQMRFEDLAG
jgi:hypothetical protein